MRRLQSHTGQLGTAVWASAERRVKGSITDADAQLRAAPPLRAASVLSPSRLEPLAASSFTPPIDAGRRDGAQVLTFRTKAWSSFAPPTCRMPLGQYQDIPELIPEEGSPPGFDIA